MGGRQACPEAASGPGTAAGPAAGDPGVVDRAAGLLAGRTRCRLAEAHRYLLHLAGDQNRDLTDVAAGVIGLLDVPETAAGHGPPMLPRLSGPGAADTPVEPWLAVVQAVLELVPGQAALLTPVRDPEGRLTDLVYAAVSPSASTPDGRRGRGLIGVRVAVQFPPTFVSERWAAYEQVLETGEPAELGPFTLAGAPFTVRAHRLGSGLFLTWTRRPGDGPDDLAARLQQVILPLPDAPLDLPGVKVAVRYLPAGQESLVGGDWYHAATLRDGSVLLAVGDVAGHGTPAATTMAQLRHSLRALAVTTTDPATLLGHLNRLTCDLEQERPETAATAIVARWEPAQRRLTWAQAGHPPPLLSRAGRTQPLVRPAGPMLGVVEDARYECAQLRLAPGDVLLLYTDGLVERRGRSLDDGMAEVIRTVEAAVVAAPRQPLTELLSRLQLVNPDDDTCILAVGPT